MRQKDRQVRETTKTSETERQVRQKDRQVRETTKASETDK